MIFIYDNSLTQLGVLNNYKSFSYKQQLRGVGNFTLIVAYSKTNVENLQVGNIISLDGDSGIIVSTTLKQSSSGQILTVQGTTLLGLLNQRIGTSYVDTDVTETLAKTIVNDNCVNATDTDRNFSNLTIETDTLSGTSQDISTGNKFLIKELEGVLSTDNYGHCIKISANSFVYGIIYGEDKTAEVQFSNNLHNIKDASQLKSNSSYRNFVYVYGKDINDTYGTASGFDRRELYLKDTRITIPASLTDRAIQELDSKYKQVDNISTLARISGNPFEYGVDYVLGDFVTAVFNGTVYEVQITEVQTEYKESGKSIILTLGTPIRSFAEQITDIRESE